MEEQLRQSQKMEAIGTLAGGIAHDFNNILGSILGYNELAMSQQNTKGKYKNYLEQVHTAGLRAKGLVSQLLTFSRQSHQSIKPTDVTTIVKEVLQLIRSTIPSNINITSHITTQECLVNGDATGIHQIVMNLCTNAAVTMQHTGGCLEVLLDNVDMDQSQANLISIQTGPFVKMTISDTGTGISPDVLPRIFDPFFTTKDVGKGTGLGLSTVHGIIKDYGGAINVETQVGEGTSFTVHLPRLMQKIDDLDKTDTVETIKTGKGTILLVDDELALAELGSTQLEAIGYRAVSYVDVRKALERFKADPEEFDAVITDQAMPHMTGFDLAKIILSIRPDIPVFLCTGFSQTVTLEKAKANGLTDMLMKPVSIKTLASVLHEALSKESTL